MHLVFFSAPRATLKGWPTSRRPMRRRCAPPSRSTGPPTAPSVRLPSRQAAYRAAEPPPEPPSRLPSRQAAHRCAQYAFPDAYIGQSTSLRDTMINLIIQAQNRPRRPSPPVATCRHPSPIAPPVARQSPQDWHTSAMLPFRAIEGTVRRRWARSPSELARHPRPLVTQRQPAHVARRRSSGT